MSGAGGRSVAPSVAAELLGYSKAAVDGAVAGTSAGVREEIPRIVSSPVNQGVTRATDCGGG